MTFPTPLIVYTIGGDLADDALLRWFSHILDPGETNILQTILETISISYGDYSTGRISRWTMRGPWASYSYTSVLEASVSSSRAGLRVLALRTAKTMMEITSLSPDCLHPVRVVYYHPFQALDKGKYKSPDRHSANPRVTTVGGTTGQAPEVAARLSGGGYFTYFPRPMDQVDVVGLFLLNHDGDHAGLYK